MSFSQNEVFTFTWSIDNFSMCPHKCGQLIKSPKFSVDILEKSEWNLYVYPRGNKSENNIACFLYHCGTGPHPGEITLGFKIAIISSKTGMILNELTTVCHTFISEIDWGWNDLISRDDVFAQKEEYLPNDIFTIQCSMWCLGNASEDNEKKAVDLASIALSSSETVLFKEMLSNANEKSLKAIFNSPRGSARTIIKVKKRIICWPIKHFSTLRPYQRLSIPLSSCLVNVPSFYLTFHLSSSKDHEQFAQIEIRRKETDCSKTNFVMCQISVVNTPKSSLCFTKDEHLFETKVTDDVWKFPLNIKFSELEEEKYLEATSDVLYLRCEFSFSQLGDLYHTEDVDLSVQEDHSVRLSDVFNPLKNLFKNFYKDGEFSDVSLQVSDRIFRVHKIILSARSSVFRTMFNNEMKEKETGVVDIIDLSTDTVDRMLAFMYNDTLEDLEPCDAIELYTAADKYQVLPLKFQCNCVLKSTLSVANMCDILRLSDLHNDEDLRDAVQEFMHSNSRVILESPEWKDLMKEDPELAADVMYKMLNKLALK